MRATGSSSLSWASGAHYTEGRRRSHKLWVRQKPLKQSEARMSAHRFDKALFFSLPQSVLWRRRCVAKLLRRIAGGEGSRYTDCSLGKENWARGPGAGWKVVLVYMGSLAGGC